VDVHTVNPLTDPRWGTLVARHPQASVFHERGWLAALAETYGYEPVALCGVSPDQQLSAGIVFCRVSSWITGTRLVSLPFSDHCDPLVGDASEFDSLLGYLREQSAKRKYKYIEVRALKPFVTANSGLRETVSFCFHTLGLRDDLSRIFHGFHGDCVKRKIRRAEREQLSCETGTSEESIREFYRLLVRTRKRHNLLPQPLAWFRNLARLMGDRLTIRIAKKDAIPIAGLLSLRHRETTVYKYGCSDERFHNLGAVPFLFWNLIKDSNGAGVEQLDFGRSDWSQQSLILFKDRFGAERRSLSYFRLRGPNERSMTSRIGPMVQRWVPHIPDAILSVAGRIAYRHVG
jgi:Acetyltransferase (GNAT) domain